MKIRKYESCDPRQVAVLYYTGHIVYAIAIHTKGQMMLWLKTIIMLPLLPLL